MIILFIIFRRAMFPYQVNNGFGNYGYPYLVNHQMSRNMIPETTSYVPQPSFYQHYMSPQQNQYNYFPLINHRPYFNDGRLPNTKIHKANIQKRKRITKKLSGLDLRKQIRHHYKQYKAKSKTFKYFDPSRAPPITSLRNQFEIQLDCKNQDKNIQTQKSQQQFPGADQTENIKRLEILLEEPDVSNYPFLICKRRKYYRNLKRRYSVSYFQQRAHYILNQLPIPAQLQPKNKIRKSRCGLKNEKGQVIEQESCQYEESSQYNSQSQKDSDKEWKEKKNYPKQEINAGKSEKNQNNGQQNVQKSNKN